MSEGIENCKMSGKNREKSGNFEVDDKWQPLIMYLFCFQLGELLISKRHIASDDIRQVVTRLMSKWNELLKASENRGKGLGEVKDILEFNEQVDKVQDWIREKV